VPAVATAPPSTTASAASSTDGDIVTPASAGSHRVFVDGHYAGDSPAPVRVHCGTHTVKIGSGGVLHTVDVPCGGEVSVSPR
jgi:serine/threonine-protein kinase